MILGPTHLATRAFLIHGGNSKLLFVANNTVRFFTHFLFFLRAGSQMELAVCDDSSMETVCSVVHHVLQSVNKIDIRCALNMCPQPERRY